METLPITEVKTRLTEVVVQVEKQRDRILITRNGKPGCPPSLRGRMGEHQRNA